MSTPVSYSSLNIETRNKYSVVMIDINTDEYWVESIFDDVQGAIDHIRNILVTDYDFVLYSPAGKFITKYNNS